MMSHLGDAIKNGRIKKGLTQTDLAKILGYSSPQYISNVERGRCSLTHKKLAKVAKLLKISKTAIKQTLIKDFAERLKKKGL